MKERTEINITAPLDHIPVFVKSNSFYLTGRIIRRKLEIMEAWRVMKGN